MPQSWDESELTFEDAPKQSWDESELTFDEPKRTSTLLNVASHAAGLGNAPEGATVSGLVDRLKNPAQTYDRERLERGLAEQASAPVSGSEAVQRGMNAVTAIGPWTDEALAALGAGQYAVAKGVRSLLPGGVPEGAPDIGEVYARLREENAKRDKKAFDEQTTMYRVGEGASLVGQAGGAKDAVKGAWEGAKAIPAALRALLTKEGLAAAAAGSAKLGAGGAALGAVSGAGSAEPGHRLEGAQSGAVTGGLTGAAIGAPLGAMQAGAAQAARGAAARAGAAQTLEAADAAEEAAQKLNDSNKQAYEVARSEFDDAAAAHAAEVERLRQQHAADVAQGGAERTALQERAQAQHAAEVERLRQQHAADVAEASSARYALEESAAAERAAAEEAAAQAARAPTKEKAVRLFGLEGMKDQERARRSAEGLFEQPAPEGSGRLVDRLLSESPKQGLTLLRGLKEQAGKELGSVRTALAERGARANVGPLLGELRQELGALPSGAREAAANSVDDLILKGAPMGEMDAAHIRQAIDSLNIPSKFGATLPNGTAARETAPVFRRARAALLDLEKQLVAEHLPEAAQTYTDSLRKYSLFSDAELGALKKFGRENKGLPPVNFPDPEPVTGPAGPYDAKVAAPVLPEKPSGPYDAKVAPPVLPDAPALPKRPVPVPIPERPDNEEALRALVTGKPSLTGRAAKFAAGAAGRAFGGKVGSAVSRAAVDHWFQSFTPSAAELGAQATKRAAVAARLEPVFKRALAAGPAMMNLVHNLLMERDPEYAEMYSPPNE